MPPDIGHVATAFCAAGIVLGLASAVAVLFSLVFCVRLRRRAPANAAAIPVGNPDAVIIAIYGIARVVGAMAGVVGAIGKVAAFVLLLFSTAGLALATLMYFTGQGLYSQEGWARATAVVICAGAIVLSLSAILVLRGSGRVLPLATATAAMYALAGIFH